MKYEWCVRFFLLVVYEDMQLLTYILTYPAEQAIYLVSLRDARSTVASACSAG